MLTGQGGEIDWLYGLQTLIYIGSRDCTGMDGGSRWMMQMAETQYGHKWSLLFFLFNGPLPMVNMVNMVRVDWAQNAQFTNVKG